MAHIWMSHVTLMTKLRHTYPLGKHTDYAKESCHTYEAVMSHIWMSHVTHMIESRQTYDWVMSHIWMSHVTQSDGVGLQTRCMQMSGPDHTRGWAMLHILAEQAYHCMYAYGWVESHTWMSHITRMNESWHTFTWSRHTDYVRGLCTVSHAASSGKIGLISCSWDRSFALLTA